MTNEKAPLTIIGTGVAGYTLAREFRNLDKETPLHLITADDGAFYSKPLISNALSQGKTAANLAMMPATTLAKQLNATVDAHAHVTGINPLQATVTIAEKTHTYSQLVLACGAHPVHLTWPGDANNAIYSVNNLMDYAHFYEALQNKKRIVILGAGLIGCEFANDLRKAGYEVDVVALSPTPLEQLLPPLIGSILQQALANIGVRWHLNTRVVAINHLKQQQQIVLDNGQTLIADVVLSAIGIKPAIELARAAGLNVGRGIIVDRYLRTSEKNVYAVGDCAEVAGHLLQYITPIMRGARALAKTLAGELTAVSYPAMPVVVKTPDCPLVLVLPPFGLAGEWQIVEQSGIDVKALYYDMQGKPQGFILMGHKIPERNILLKEMPVLLPDIASPVSN